MHHNQVVSLSVCSCSVREKAHNSCTTLYIFIKFGIHMHVNIVNPLAYVTAFFDGQTLLSTNPVGCGQFVKMLITLEPQGIFWSNLHSYLF